ncbi:MAG: hypothetical protein M3P48_05135 [Actinomycetota bacterium]|nr:hypothetical protein [Actinomycetota bacterium]
MTDEQTRRRAAEAAGLPSALADRLKGATELELLRDAAAPPRRSTTGRESEAA